LDSLARMPRMPDADVMLVMLPLLVPGLDESEAMSTVTETCKLAMSYTAIVLLIDQLYMLWRRVRSTR